MEKCGKVVKNVKMPKSGRKWGNVAKSAEKWRIVVESGE